MTQPLEINIDPIYRDIRQLIEAAKSQVVAQVNQALVLTYWQIGKTIKQHVIIESRAEYGEATMQKLARKLVNDYGNGFSRRNLFRMAKFYQQFTDQAIVTTLSAQLSWSHFVELIKIEDELKRAFYIRLCSEARWPVRTLRERMDSMLYERTALSKQADVIIAQELAAPTSPQLFLKDPYLLDFLDLKDGFTEKDLENAILAELERFILELGSDFAFMSRQQRIQIGGNDYYIDLLFFHRKLRRLVLIELKLGEFKAEYKGQVELYLKWLAKYEQQSDENPPIAIILCSDKDIEVIELLDLEQDHIHVAEYWLQLPPKAVLQAKLHKAMAEAKARLEYRAVQQLNEDEQP
jgi:predicted nuclease of restriction endonuclease-like (RecB) superfamily